MRSAGILPFRRSPVLQVLIAHPGGPVWANKDEGAWSLIKGLIDPDEDERLAAAREFTEETGWRPPPEPWLDLGTVRLKSGKVVVGWAAEADYDPGLLVPEPVTMTLGGRTITVPEIDRVQWFAPDEARRKLNPAYGPFLDLLERQVTRSG